MIDTRSYPAYPSDLNVFNSFHKLEEYLSKCKFKEDTQRHCPNTGYDLYTTSSRTIQARKFEEFMDLLKEFSNSIPIKMHGHFINKKKEEVACIIDISKSELRVKIESGDLNIISAFHERVKEFFQASNPLDNEDKPVSRYNLKKTVFLAHRFDNYGNEVSSRLCTFLSRLGFDVLEGSGYEARDIPDKVMEKIRSQDIFICVVTPGDSSWILSEASTAKAINKYLILIHQSGLDFNKGIIGKDYEHLVFPDDNIEKIYSDLLYALP